MGDRWINEYETTALGQGLDAAASLTSASSPFDLSEPACRATCSWPGHESIPMHDAEEHSPTAWVRPMPTPGDPKLVVEITDSEPTLV